MMASEIKPGDRVWIPAEAEKSSTEGHPHLSFRFKDGQYADYLYSDLGPILGHPALPALARLLVGEPGLAGAVTRMVAISQLAQAMLYEDGELSSASPHHQELVARLEAITLPHDWEALGRLTAALGTEDGDGK